MSKQNLFNWNDEYSVGIQEIDEQHKDLVDLLNQLHDAIQERHGTQACRNILNRLADYTRIHFTVEESLMRVVNYPGYDEHKQIHEDLISQVVGLQEKLDSGKASITFELLHFLKVWLQKHIIESDKEFGQFFLNVGFAPKWSPHVQQSMTKKTLVMEILVKTVSAATIRRRPLPARQGFFHGNVQVRLLTNSFSYEGKARTVHKNTTH